jgi:pimeloyl-ACP methyl ester carboxylesterase
VYPRRFFTIVISLALALGAITGVAAQDTEYRPIEDHDYGVRSVVPAEWQDAPGGTYSRGTPPEDLARITIQSAAATADLIWGALLPRFQLDEVPELTEVYGTELGDWDLYRVDVEVGAVTVTAELALLEDEGTTSLILLQADPEEFDVLREQVFIPAVDAFAPLTPEPTPHPSTFDYQIEEVAFPGGSDGVELAGTLTLPDGPGPHPIVITMSGSGAQDRDESLRPITTLKPFAIIADALTSAGVGVLRYDDRGVGGSTGDYSTATIEDLAEDARSAIDYLETRDDVDAERIGLFGHSEGGLYSSILGASDPRVAWIGMMAPAIIDGVTLLVEQNIALAESTGSSAEQVEAIGAWASEAMPLAVEGDFEMLEQVTRDFYTMIWEGLDPDEQLVAGERDAFVQGRLDRELPIYTSDWYRSLLAYDSADDWREVTVPVLSIFGGLDVQVIAESNQAALEALLADADNDDFTTFTIPDANHLFQDAETGALAEYGQFEPEFIDGFVEDVVNWTVKRAGVAE